MPTLDELMRQGHLVQLVIAERLGLDPSEVTHLGVEGDTLGEYIYWSSRRQMPHGFLGECLTEASRRLEEGT